MSIDDAQTGINASLFYQLTVKKIVEETDQAKSFALEPDRAVAQLFNYQPGQFLNFQIAHESGIIERCYSISSAPDFDPYMTVCVKRVDQGLGSNWFNDKVQTGSRLFSHKPSGRFVLNESESDLFIIAGGSGITPCIALIKQALNKTRRNVQLVYANQNNRSIIYFETINFLQQHYPDRFKCHHWLDDEKGFMQPQHILDLAYGKDNSSCYICGPAALMDMAEDTLSSKLGDEAHIVTEKFISPAPVSKSNDSLKSPRHKTDSALTEFQLKIDDSTHTIKLSTDQSLLEAALSTNLDIPHSCTEGHCGSCMAQLVNGDVNMVSTQALSKRNIEKGYILLCQSYPSTDKPLLVDMDF